MSLRKSFDSFAPQHKLRDAEEAYEQNVSDLKREMDFLFRKVEHYRHCLYAARPWRSIWNIPQLLLIGVAPSLLGSDLNAGDVSNDVTWA